MTYALDKSPLGFSRHLLLVPAFMKVYDPQGGPPFKRASTSHLNTLCTAVKKPCLIKSTLKIIGFRIIRSEKIRPKRCRQVMTTSTLLNFKEVPGQTVLDKFRIPARMHCKISDLKYFFEICLNSKSKVWMTVSISNCRFLGSKRIVSLRSWAEIVAH